ncbi:MAG: hypothetical protein FWH20_10060 [Oscillospiraceae bacterium]|nr:hypothetical protein [Oscillospiraceae bacterium]
MAGSGNMGDMLQSLLSALNKDLGQDEGAESAENSSAETSSGENFSTGADFSSFFENIDLDMIMKLGEMFAKFNHPDKNTELLRALKPHLRDENRDKIETAIKLLKITALLPMLRESGFMDKIF